MRHIVEHLRESDAAEQLNKLVEHPHWYSARMAHDPSGESYQADLKQAWSAVKQRSRDHLGRGQIPVEIATELRYALAFTSINSLSNNLSAELLEALVACGHWDARTALAAAKINPDTSECLQAIAALAPHFDVALTSDAVRLVRSDTGRLFSEEALSALLGRLCDLECGERALAEAKLLVGDEQAFVLGEIADRLSEALLGDAIASAIQLASSDRRIRALALLLRRAPEARLVDMEKAVLAVYNRDRDELWAAIAVRWAELRQIDRARDCVEKITSSTTKAKALGEMLFYVPKEGSAQLAEEALTLVKERGASARAKVLVNVISALPPQRQLEATQHVLAVVEHDNFFDDTLKILGPILPTALINDALTVAKQLKDGRQIVSCTSVAIRLAELGQVDDAINVATDVGDSYQVSNSLNELLPRLAKLGYVERAASEALNLGRNEAFLPRTLVGVARHVPKRLLDKLRDRALGVPDVDRRRLALLGIAPRYAKLGHPEEALALACRIDDDKDFLALRVRVALSWAFDLREPERALAQVLSLPRCYEQMRALETLVAELPIHSVREALTRIRANDPDPETTSPSTHFSRRYAIAALLRRLATQRDNVEEAWQFANGEAEDDRYFLLATVADYLTEPERTSRLESSLQDLLAESFEKESWRRIALQHLIPHLTEGPLQAVVKHCPGTETINIGGDIDFIGRCALRFCKLGQGEKGLHLTLQGNRWQLSDTLAEIAPYLDEKLTRIALSQVKASDWKQDQRRTIPPLLARLAELGRARDTLQEIRGRPHDEVKCDAITAVAPRLPRDLLEEAIVLVQNSGSKEATHARENALAAIACRYGALGHLDDGMKIAGLIPEHSDRRAHAIAGLAPILQGALLEEALDLSVRHWASGYESVALPALLPRIAEQSIHGAHRALGLACGVFNAKERRTALLAVLPCMRKFPASDLYSLWSNALHLVSNRDRREFLSDLEALIPILAQLGNAEALNSASSALEYIASRWP